MVCIGLATVLALVVFPPRRLAVTADGSRTEIISRQQDMVTVLSASGLKHTPGDLVLRDGRQLLVERAVPVVVEADGRALSWRSRATTVQALLSELDIPVSPYDTIAVNGIEVGRSDAFGSVQGSAPAAVAGLTTYSDASIVVNIQRAVPLTIIEDGRAISVKSSRANLSTVLREAGIQLGPADEIFPSLNAVVTAGMEVQIKHAKAVNLRVGNSTTLLYTHSQTLKDTLAEAGLALGPDDRVEPAPEVAVTNGMTARLVRVGGRTLIEKDPVKRKTVFKPDESLSGSGSRVVQGKDGVTHREYRVVIEDGVEREKKLIKEWQEPEVENTVIYYAASTIRATGLTPENFNSARTEHMYATWYNAASSGKPATDPNYGFTRTGTPVTRGIVAVDPTVIPLGTRLYVPGYGFAVAADTGGGVIGKMIDLGFPDGVTSDWHTGWVDVYILAP
jgi:uncharacterized protein YabE (DUF348 family)/3D (Asp-Asp-Asp) domain-containing protein